MRIPIPILTLVSAFLLVGVTSPPQLQAEILHQREPSIWGLPSIADVEIDIGYWALRIARECDSTVDIQHYLRMLDTMAAGIRYMVGPRDGDMVRFMMAKMYQFDSGAWNGGQVFRYDLDDPLGEQPGSKLLTTYLDTHRGNCVSMPTLFLALMERVDPSVPFHGVAAPMHLFCRFHDRQDGQVWNIEATNGGNRMRDEWAIEQLAIPRVAIDSGTYMRDLTKKEYVANLLSILTSRYRRAGDFDTALRYADLMLQLDPRSLLGLVQKGSLLAWKGQTLKERVISENRYPTKTETKELDMYSIESAKYIDRARALGWKPESAESREDYLRTVDAARSSDAK